MYSLVEIIVIVLVKELGKSVLFWIIQADESVSCSYINDLFLIFSACLVNDINIFDYTVLLLALIAAETAMALSLIIGSRGLSGRLSVRNNVSNYSTYLPKCQHLLSGPLGRRHPSGAVHMAPSYICYMDNCFCNE